MSFCTKCGTQVQEGIKFCGNCGNAMQGGNTPQASQSPNLEGFQTKPAKKSNGWWGVLAFAIAFIIFKIIQHYVKF